MLPPKVSYSLSPECSDWVTQTRALPGVWLHCVMCKDKVRLPEELILGAGKF